MTVATGALSKAECDRTGLVECHAYAVSTGDKPKFRSHNTQDRNHTGDKPKFRSHNTQVRNHTGDKPTFPTFIQEADSLNHM